MRVALGMGAWEERGRRIGMSMWRILAHAQSGHPALSQEKGASDAAEDQREKRKAAVAGEKRRLPASS
tara:strand:+ start:108 stop:311 length:204 start_codon:yes stop_codon:yes gene_type:complete